MKHTIHITVSPDRSCWQADFTHARDAMDVYRAFGTFILPCPFTADASPSDVRDAIARRNPGHDVIVGGAR